MGINTDEIFSDIHRHQEVKVINVEREADILDNNKIYLGTDKDFSLRYDSADNYFYLRDEDTPVNLLKLIKNTPIEFDIAFPAIFETAKTGLDATETGVVFESQIIIPVISNYATDVAIEATWTASNTDSVTKIGVFDVTTGAYICAVDGNTGTDKKSAYAVLKVGNKNIVQVEVTTASSWFLATTDITKAVVYVKVKIS